MNIFENSIFAVMMKNCLDAIKNENGEIYVANEEYLREKEREEKNKRKMNEDEKEASYFGMNKNEEKNNYYKDTDKYNYENQENIDREYYVENQENDYFESKSYVNPNEDFYNKYEEYFYNTNKEIL